MTTVAEKTLETIEAKIAQTKEALQNVHGRETEVYARIVGYYRSVRNWNKGKREEYDHRKMFEYEHELEEDHHAQIKAQTETEFKSIETKQSFSTEKNAAISYEFFSRKTCPNCPAVKEFLSNSNFSGSEINVDTFEGLERAKALQILSAPTVVFFNEDGKEIARAQSVKELSVIFEPQEALTKAC